MLRKLQEKWENDRSDLLFVHLCNPGEPRPGMPALLQGLKSYLLRASHQSPERCLQQFQIRIGLTPHQVRATCVTVSRLSRGVVFPGASLRVHLSAGSPFHCYHPEPKKLSQLWSHPAAPASKWGLIPRKPWKDRGMPGTQHTIHPGIRLRGAQSSHSHLLHSLRGSVYTVYSWVYLVHV